MDLSVSIVIPTFNEEKYLPKLLKSIKKQTIQPKEIIVSDAFSTDSTRKIARSFGCKVVDGGLPGKARNCGAQTATQPLLLFLDADVIIPPKFLEKTIEEMMKKDYDIATCYVRAMSPLKIDKILYESLNYYTRLTKKIYPHLAGACIFVKKSLHHKLNGFDESLVLGEEHDYIRRAKKLGKVHYGYLHAYKVSHSVRRQVKEGRMYLSLKYILIEFHLIFIGKIKKNYFNYKFGEYTK